MSDVAAQLRELAQPWAGGEKIKVVIGRAARRAGLNYWRAFDIWYGKARRIEEHERSAIAAALEAKGRKDLRDEFYQLQAQMARLESLLVQSDPDFHRPSIDAVRSHVRAIGGKPRA